MNSNRLLMTVALAALTTMSLLAGPGAASGGMAGHGTIQVPGCPPDVGPLVARQLTTEWRIDYGFGCSNPKFAYQGTYDPAAGGCLPYIFGSDGHFCMGGIPSAGTPTTVSIQLCTTAIACNSGTATVVRT